MEGCGADALVEYDHTVETLTTDTADEPLDIGDCHGLCDVILTSSRLSCTNRPAGLDARCTYRYALDMNYPDNQR